MPGHSTNGSAAPEGGGVEPSRSAGRYGSSLALDGVVGTVMNVAGEPASIAARLNANGCGPR